jgi:voltage-gated potassium channel
METRNPSYLLFMLILSALAIVATAVEVVLPLSLDAKKIVEFADTVVCILFLLDFVAMLVRAKNKLRYMYTWGWLDLISSIPAVNVLRWGRLARVARILRVLRTIRSARVLTSFIYERRAQSTLLAALLATIILVTAGAVSILYFEQTPEGNIRTAEDSIWWAVGTVTTVGYGDRYPVTTEGRMVAAFLMSAGVGLFGTLSGSVAAWFLSPGKGAGEVDLKALQDEIRELRDALAAKEKPEAVPAGSARGD